MDKLVFLLAFIAFLFANKLPEGVAKILNFEPIYKKYGEKYGIDWRLLKAISQVESNENPVALNPADPSYGLMQLLFPNRLPAVLNWPPGSAEELYNPDYNVDIGSQILKWNITNFGLKRGIAVYNNWSARSAPIEGPFPNQAYVDKVLEKYASLGGVA